MLVKSLEQMESIVKKNRNLKWDGWTVVDIQQTDKGRTSKSGLFSKGKWHLEKRYELTDNGWNIPDGLMHG